MAKKQNKTGGRAATTGHIAGDYALSVGMPPTAAPSGWKWTLLTDVARLETGHTPSRKFPEYWDGDVPWIGIRDATGNHGQTIHETNQYTTDLGIENSSARILPANTVCLSRTASVGYVIVMGKPMATSQDFVNWVCSDDLDYRFLMYVLLAEKRSFLRFAHGTTHQTIYFPEVKAFHICLPPIEVQRAIASILGALDDKIELNRRMNATLESLARAKFKSWFVDFDPVHANAIRQNAGKTGAGQMPASSAIPTTHDPKVLDLFPSTFQDSELGPIPEGWNAKPLSDVCDLLSGGTPKKKIEEYWNGNLPWISPKAMNGIHVFESDSCVTQAAVGNGTRLVPAGTTLVMVRGMGLHQGVRISQAKRDVTFNQDVKALVPTTVDSTFLLYAMLDAAPILFGKVRAAGHGTGVLSTDIIKSLEFAVPEDGLSEFTQPLTELNQEIHSNELESQTLADLRDSLLPQLLSGELSPENTYLESTCC